MFPEISYVRIKVTFHIFLFPSYKVNTLQNWLTEFNLWLPPQEALPPDTDPTFVTGRTFKVHILNDEHKYVT